MSDLLVVMNPRKIRECVDAFRELPIDKLWLRNMTEWDIQEAWPKVMEYAVDYDHLIIGSDDGIPRKHALAAVQRFLNKGAPVVTGYSNFAANDLRVNIATRVDWYTLADVQSWVQETNEVYQLGFALSGMKTELWQRFPFRVYWDTPPGSRSDNVLSDRLNAAGIPILAARDAFVWHVKENWDQQDVEERKKLYVGVEPPSIQLEVW